MLVSNREKGRGSKFPEASLTSEAFLFGEPIPRWGHTDMGSKATKKKSGATAVDDKVCPTCSRRYREGAGALLEQMLERIEDQLSKTEVKPTISEYLRLLQFREELRGEEQPKEIKVTWLEPTKRS
jgi:hypothetical protein